jgi:protein-S-isoprenylcysteine O-methyltransferase Ste14
MLLPLWSLETIMNLLIFFGLYLAAAFLWRSIVVHRRSGINPLVRPARDDAAGYVSHAFAWLISAIALHLLQNAFASGYSPAPVALLSNPMFERIGWLTLWVSLVTVVVAQIQMGNSWRIGIDTKNGTELIAGGLFRWSRNPIFLSMRLNLLGLLMVLPNTITFASLLVAEVLIQIQVRLEEQHLETMHADHYRHYKASVRRWL